MTGPARFLVAGEWRSSGKARSVVNPYKNETAWDVYQATPADIEDAITAAVNASKATREYPAYKRTAILNRIADELERRREEFAGLITHETGKPITFSRVEAERAAFTFRVAAEEAGRIGGEILPLDRGQGSEGRTALVRRFALGAISAITPFNFPLNLVAHKLGPALAAGNAVILKPSSNAPRTALELGRLVEEAGYEKGGVNVLPCASDEAGQLVIDERIKLISFTGSPDVGWGLKARAGKKKITLELGGNAGVIVDRSASLPVALKRLVWGSFANAGQSCIAVQRIFVHEAIYDDFMRQFVAMAREVKVGDPEEAETVVGPMITEDAARKVEEWMREAVAAGARITCGGGRRGAVMDPTVLENVRPSMKVCSQEVFAPVVTVETFSDFDDAIQRVNHSAFGLQAGVFTNDLRNAMTAFARLEVGGVIVNDASTYRMDHMPYGGVKDSGFGREGLRYAIEEMTEMKLLALNII